MKFDLKSPVFFPFGANMTHLGPNLVPLCRQAADMRTRCVAGQRKKPRYYNKTISADEMSLF